MAIRILGSSCAAALFAVATAAAAGQAAPPAPAQTPPGEAPRPAAAQSPRSDDQVTLVGCVARATPGNSGNQFVLRNASMETSGASATADARPGSAGAVGTTGSASADAAGRASTGASASSASTYSLTGMNESDLSPYVGQRVEVTGSIDRMASAGAAASTPARGADTSANARPARDGDPDAADDDRPAGASTPGSPVAGAPGSTTAAPGSTTRAGDSPAPGERAAGADSADATGQRAAGSAAGPMQALKVVSVRPVSGGDCQ